MFFPENSLNIIHLVFQTSLWGWQWILPMSQRVFSQSENKKVDKSWVGNNQETDGETSTVCWLCIDFFQLSCLSSFLDFWMENRFQTEAENKRHTFFCTIQVFVCVLCWGTDSAATEETEDAPVAAGQNFWCVKLQRPPGRNPPETEHRNKSHR